MMKVNEKTQDRMYSMLAKVGIQKPQTVKNASFRNTLATRKEKIIKDCAGNNALLAKLAE